MRWRNGAGEGEGMGEGRGGGGGGRVAHLPRQYRQHAQRHMTQQQMLNTIKPAAIAALVSALSGSVSGSKSTIASHHSVSSVRLASEALYSSSVEPLESAARCVAMFFRGLGRPTQIDQNLDKYL